MIFYPYLQCKHCPAHIELPLPIRSETTPNQTRWPWGADAGNFLCQSCRHPSLYWSEELHWHRVQNTAQSRMSTSLAVHQIDISCGVEQCPGLLHILAVMNKGSRLDDAANLVSKVLWLGTTCDNGHANRGFAERKAFRCTEMESEEEILRRKIDQS